MAEIIEHPCIHSRHARPAGALQVELAARLAGLVTDLEFVLLGLSRFSVQGARRSMLAKLVFRLVELLGNIRALQGCELLSLIEIKEHAARMDEFSADLGRFLAAYRRDGS